MFVVLVPLILLASGALITLVAEPYLTVDRKHRVLPWMASATTAGAAVALAWLFLGTESTVSLYDFLSFDATRAWY